MMAGLKVVMGGSMIARDRPFSNEHVLQAMFEILQRGNVHNIDTAQVYGQGQSEELLGLVDAGSQFVLDTKIKGGLEPGSATKENLVKLAQESMARLGVDKVDTFYIHAPDTSIPISETLAGINQVHKAGLFARFGLSNYHAKDVEAVYEHCQAHGYVLPSVYQGNYSAVARKQDTLLFPTLRKLGMSFYAYSPLAGGFLTKTKQQILDGAGRFNDAYAGGMYKIMYSKPAYLEALALWKSIADEVGCSQADLAYRWVMYNSPLKHEQGDAIIIGATSLQQIEKTLQGLKDGPLPQEAVEKIDQVWKTIEHEAPLDNFYK